MSTVLQFSGGKDSLACLYLLRPRWSDIIVAWTNTGAAFPETLEYMERIRAMVPNFHEIRSEQTIRQHGYPADVLPMGVTVLGRAVTGTTGAVFQPSLTCCSAALWVPMDRAMRELGATTVIRGQKRADKRKAPLVSGQVVDGIRYEFPLEDWTDAQVYAYLREVGAELPPNYPQMGTSLDCWNCTAYLDEQSGKLDYLAARHPEKHAHVVGIIRELQAAVRSESAALTDFV